LKLVFINKQSITLIIDIDIIINIINILIFNIAFFHLIIKKLKPILMLILLFIIWIPFFKHIMIIIRQLLFTFTIFPNLNSPISALSNNIFFERVNSNSQHIMIMFYPLQLLRFLNTPNNRRIINTWTHQIFAIVKPL
jgi:hypothetical protein